MFIPELGPWSARNFWISRNRSRWISAVLQNRYAVYVLGYNDFDIFGEKTSPDPDMDANFNSETHLYNIF
jgi:hypothetical protein